MCHRALIFHESEFKASSFAVRSRRRTDKLPVAKLRLAVADGPKPVAVRKIGIAGRGRAFCSVHFLASIKIGLARGIFAQGKVSLCCRPEMRARLALGNGRRPEHRAPDALWPLRRSGEVNQGQVAAGQSGSRLRANQPQLFRLPDNG